MIKKKGRTTRYIRTFRKIKNALNRGFRGETPDVSCDKYKTRIRHTGMLNC